MLLQRKVWGELSRNSYYGLHLARTGGRLENIEKECGKKWTYCCTRRWLVHAREIKVFLEGETGYMGESVIIVEQCNTGDKAFTG